MFTTPSGVASDTTSADFGAGTTGASTYVSNTAGGEVTLAPSIGAELDGTTIPPDWSTGSWTGGATTVAGGHATIDGSWLRADALAGSGRAVEFAGTFSGDAFQNAGFGVTFDAGGESWAMFGTNATAGTLQARTLDGGGSGVDVPLGSQYIGSPHRFRVEWDSSVRFYIDGTLVHTAATVSGTMRPIASDFATGGGALSIEWVRTTPYAAGGSFMSRIHDAGGHAGWGSLSYVANAPAGTSVALLVRTGPTPVPDGSWSAFAPVAHGGDIPTVGRYAQYRADLTTTSTSVTPTLSSVRLPFNPIPVAAGGADDRRGGGGERSGDGVVDGAGVQWWVADHGLCGDAVRRVCTPLPPTTFGSTATTQVVTGLDERHAVPVPGAGRSTRSARAGISTATNAGGRRRRCRGRRRSARRWRGTAGDGVVDGAGVRWWFADHGLCGDAATSGAVPAAADDVRLDGDDAGGHGADERHQYRFRVQADQRGRHRRAFSTATERGGRRRRRRGRRRSARRLAGNGPATVSWTAPASNGGSPITGYVVTPLHRVFTPQPPTTFGSTATTQIVTGLTNGTQYRFRVQAINAVGTSGRSMVTNPVTPTA